MYSKDSDSQSSTTKSGKLENRFNKDDVQKELDFQREVTEKFGQNVVEAGSLLANKFGEEAKAKRHEAAIALEEAEKAKAENNNETNRALVKQARDNFETASREAKEWETGGSQRLVIDSALNVISTALAGRPAAEVVASGLSPAVNNQIKKATTDAKGNVNTALNLTAHALWGAVEAYAGNRNVAAGAAGAAGGEAAAHFLASTLYDKSPEKLSEEEKRTVSSLSQVAAGIAGGSLSDSSDGAIIAAKTAKDAVENNYLYNGEVNSLVKELAKAEKEGRDTKPIFEKYAKLSEKNRQEILKICGNNPTCYIPHIQMMQSGDEAAYENFSYLRLGTYFNNLSRETQVKLSDFVELENGKTRNQLPKSVHYATLALGAAEAVGLGGLALKTKLPKVSVSSKGQNYSNSSVDNFYTSDVLRGYYTFPMGSRYNQMNQPKNPSYQIVRNKADYINGREYSGHALDRMQDRGILPSLVEHTIKTGSKTTNELGVSIYKDNINGVKIITNDKGKVITVTYER